MKKWVTKNGYEVCPISSGRSKAYLISKAGINVMVDTGNWYSFHRLLHSLDALRLVGNKIDLLILTHTHFDHCRNAFAIQNHYHCSILMSEKESEFSKNGYTPIPNGSFLLTRFISGIGKNIGAKWFGYRPFSSDILIDNTLDWKYNDFALQIISTAGHSEGSVSVIVDQEIAIVGDAMLGTIPNFIFPPFADDVQGLIISWGKLMKTECNLFLPGHGNAIQRDLLEREYYKSAGKYNI